MNIGIVTTWFERGAAMVSKAYRNALQGPHQVFIYARGGEETAIGDAIWDQPYVHWGVRLGHRATAIDWTDFKKWAISNRIDLLIFNEQHDWIPVIRARRELTARLGTYIDYYRSDTVPLFALYDFLLCNTRRHESVFNWHPQCLYVPWGTDLDLFKANTQPVDADSLVFFHSAGISPGRKGTLVALHAFQQIKGDCKFLLHLQCPIQNFPEIAACCASDPRIQVVNQAIPAPGLFHRGDIYVYPTLLEGIGLTIAEALASGLPAIVPDVPPMNEFVNEGENGKLVVPQEYRGRSDGYYWAECHCRPDAVAKAMHFYVDRRECLSTFKEKAREYAEARLNWNKNAAKLALLLENVRRRTDPQDLALIERHAFDKTTLAPARAICKRLLTEAGLYRRSRQLQYWIYK